MFGISGAEFMVLLLVVVLVVGPQRLPEYTRKLTQMVRQLRLFVENTKAQIAQEVGPELADLNLKDLDPRQYDPRKIVRDALGEDIDAIRNELTHPFESVMGTAQEASDAAAAAVNEQASSARASKSLSQMIEEKKQETLKERQANSAAVSAPEGEPAPSLENAGDVAAQGSGAAVAQAAAEQEAVTTQLPQVEVAAPGAEDGAAGEPAKPVESGEPAEAVEDGEPAEAVEPGQEATQAAHVPAAQPETIAIPSSLAPEAVLSDAALRPLSPRQIILAARQAARTPAEAARASVSV